MVRWIALLVFGSLIIVGFKRPELPLESRGVYRLDGYSGPMLKTLSGGLFSVAVGFQKSSQELPQISHRRRADVLLDRLEAALASFDSRLAEVSVGRIYTTTHELILTVEVRDAAKLEMVREQLVNQLSATPGVAFVGSPGRVSIE